MSLSEEDIKSVVACRKIKSYATLQEAEDMIATEHYWSQLVSWLLNSKV